MHVGDSPPMNTRLLIMDDDDDFDGDDGDGDDDDDDDDALLNASTTR